MKVASSQTLFIAIAIFCTSNLAAQEVKTANQPSGEATQLTAEQLFAGDRVTDIKIELAKNDWDEIRAQSRSFAEALGKTPAPSPFTYVKGNVTIDGVLIKGVGIRKKGFIGSLSSERPSLKIKFKEYVKQDPVDGLDRLTLNNNNQDAGRISQYLTYKLFRDSGTISPRCGFAKVTVNGKYLGIYSNVEAIKPQFLKHAFGDNSGALFEGTVADFFPSWSQKFELKNKAADKAHIDAVTDVFQEDGFDLEELNKVVDVDAFMKYWAMESIIGFWDGYCSNQNNYYIYRHPKNDKFYFIPWGTDSSFTENSPIPPYRMIPKSVHAKAIIPNRLYHKKESKDAYLATFMSMLENHWDEEEIQSEIDRLESLLRPHVMEENDSFDGVLDGYRRFIKTRRKRLMAEFEAGSPKLNSKEKTPVYFANQGECEITFSTKWFDKAPRDMQSVGEATVKLLVNGKEIELKNVGAVAKVDDRDKNNASIVIIGTRVSGTSKGKQLIIGTGLAKNTFKPSEYETTIGGVLIQPGTFGMFGAKMKMMFGTVQLDAASMKDGEPVKGTMKLSVVEMKTE